MQGLGVVAEPDQSAKWACREAAGLDNGAGRGEPWEPLQTLREDLARHVRE
jgi:hypothetical protein